MDENNQQNSNTVNESPSQFTPPAQPMNSEHTTQIIYHRKKWYFSPLSILAYIIITFSVFIYVLTKDIFAFSVMGLGLFQLPIAYNREKYKERVAQNLITPIENKKLVKPLILGFAFALLLLGGIIWYVLDQKKQDELSAKITNDVTSPYNDEESPESVVVENRGTYNKIAISGPLLIYDFTAVGSEHTEIKDRYLTINVPDSAFVYKSGPRPDNPLRKYFILTSSGKYVHINDSMGVGGDCPTDNETYTLVKKLPTSTPGYFFTEYSYDGLEKPVMNLENFNSGHHGESPSGKHLMLEEGQSNTNRCNLFYYPEALSMLITISTSNKSQLNSSLSWDDIKDDAELLGILQSLTIVE